MPGSPEPGRQLDRTALQRAFASLARHLAERGVRAHVYVAGSAPLVLAHRRSRTTMDVDALSIDPRDPVLEGVREVAREQDLRDDWLNDQIRFVSILPPRPDTRAEVLFDSESLVVTGASPAHILAMKVRAARKRDLEDIKLLARELGITTMAEVREIHRAVYPHDGIPWRAAARVEQSLEELCHERGGSAPGRGRPARNADNER